MTIKEMVDKYVGKIFETKFNGELIITEVLDDHKHCKVKFLKTGYERTTYIGQVTSGLVKDWMLPHYLGIGVVGKALNKEISSSKAYKNWCRILSRCYDEKQRHRHITYGGCTVSDYFLTFTNFEDWYYKQKNWDNPYFVLDKDLLCGKGSKIYSEDTCVFIPKEINSLLTTTKASRGDLPLGVCKPQKGRKGFRACICKDNKDYELGAFDNIQDAFSAYKVAREGYLKEKAEKWKSDLDERSYKALINWNVEITD